ncbi:MAG: tRNA (adenosine(37)-N6)-threonylcarbamoyltransferase complex ATPase subunit type 1 TsaE, partial [Corynebacterium sp.]|nr:tRNA (adenosine(37)-N6)-threonylcarbamoyltransferase complex ATPase subunit type 1 TsaE [Corynebacterium sp.]
LDEGGANSGDPLGELDAFDLDTELENAVVIAEWGGGLVEQIAERYLFISIDREPAEYAGADEDVRRFTWSWRGGL